VIITVASFSVLLLPMLLLRRFLCSKTTKVYLKYSIVFFHFLIIGSLTGVYNYLFREFPIESAFKIVSGALVLGLLIATIYQLEEPFIRTKTKTSFLNRIFVFAVLNLALISVVWILLVIEDINIFRSVQNGSMIDLKMSIIMESIFVWIVLIFFIFRIVYLYRKKLKDGISSQIEVMQAVRSDNLDLVIPRFSNDEFAIISEEVNNMIHRLREGRKVKKGLDSIAGDAMSNEIVKKISNDDFSSERKTVAILFTDIVGFTELCQETNPSDFVARLNEHFEIVVTEIKGESGLVNKFMGDAVLAYFEGENACERAFRASQKIINKSHFGIGIGLHYGEVLAGLIGASNRLEYTIIGNSVNIASRLESESRKLGKTLVMSSNFHDELEPTNATILKQSEAQIKGFDKSITIYSM